MWWFFSSLSTQSQVITFICLRIVLPKQQQLVSTLIHNDARHRQQQDSVLVSIHYHHLLMIVHVIDSVLRDTHLRHLAADVSAYQTHATQL